MCVLCCMHTVCVCKCVHMHARHTSVSRVHLWVHAHSLRTLLVRRQQTGQLFLFVLMQTHAKMQGVDGVRHLKGTWQVTCPPLPGGNSLTTALNDLPITYCTAVVVLGHKLKMALSIHFQIPLNERHSLKSLGNANTQNSITHMFHLFNINMAGCQSNLRSQSSWKAGLLPYADLAGSHCTGLYLLKETTELYLQRACLRFQTLQTSM